MWRFEREKDVLRGVDETSSSKVVTERMRVSFQNAMVFSSGEVMVKCF
jgi:hypothetical protein